MNRGSVFISLTSGGNDIMRNSYQYDAVDNILGISNNINPQSLTQQNKVKLGGSHSHSYQYDELNRLIQMNRGSVFKVREYLWRMRLNE